MLYSFDRRKPEIGSDTYVSETAIVIGDVQIGNNCYIGHGCILRGDYGTIEIGDGSAIEEGAVIHAPPDGKCTIGESVTIGHGAIVHCESIGNFATIGMGAILSLKSQVGEHSIVAEGCVVKAAQELPERVVAVGNPARIAREVTLKDQKFWNSGKKIYVELAGKYLRIGMQEIH
jgi:carbonic anhydrase/acetyltransferase-like protein (isoleucine patch superfamily)